MVFSNGEEPSTMPNNIENEVWPIESTSPKWRGQGGLAIILTCRTLTSSTV